MKQNLMNLKQIHVIIWTSVPSMDGEVTWQEILVGFTWPCRNKVDILVISSATLWTRVGGLHCAYSLRIFDHMDIEHEVTESIWDSFSSYYIILLYCFHKLCHVSSSTMDLSSNRKNIDIRMVQTDNYHIYMYIIMLLW